MTDKIETHAGSETPAEIIKRIRDKYAVEKQKVTEVKKELVDPSRIWVTFLLLGWSYGSLGRMDLQILYYLTWGGCGIWAIARLFTLDSDIRTYNNEIKKKYNLDY